MAGIERFIGMDRLTIHQCQKIAMDIGYKSAVFELCGPKGKLPCVWRDAYMGLFSIQDDREHFIKVSQVEFSNCWCENLMPATGEQHEAHGEAKEKY